MKRYVISFSDVVAVPSYSKSAAPYGEQLHISLSNELYFVAHIRDCRNCNWVTYQSE
jgi:hypothetical protein